MGKKSMKSKSEPPSRFCRDTAMTIWQTLPRPENTATLPASKPPQTPSKKSSSSKKTNSNSKTQAKSSTLRVRPEISEPIVSNLETSSFRHRLVSNDITRDDITYDDESADSSTSDSEVVWGSLRSNKSTSFRQRGLVASAGDAYGVSQASSSDEDTLRGIRGRSRTFSEHEDPGLRYQSLPFLPVPPRLRMATLNRNSRQRYSFHGSSSTPAMVETQEPSYSDKEHTFVRKKYAVLVLDKESSPLVQRYAPDDDYD